MRVFGVGWQRADADRVGSSDTTAFSDPDLSDCLLRGLVALLSSIWASASLAAFHAAVSPVSQWVFGAFTVASAILLFFTLLIVCSFLLNGTASVARRVWCAVFLVLAITAFVIQGTTASARHDEIYSWNLWAMQHWQRVPHDLSYTLAPYPQLFAYWQASFYGAQDGIVSQLMPRLATAVPTWILIASFLVVSAGRKPLWKDVCVGVAWLFLLVDTWHTLRMGYADPLAIAALSVSLLCILRYDRDPSRTAWLIAAVLLGVMAAAVKQPGVIWSCFCLPCLAFWQARERRWPGASCIPVMIAAAGVLGWLWLSMPDITNNNGVMVAAFRDRTLVDTVLLSIRRYLVDKPETSFLLALSVLLSLRKPVHLRVILLGLLPFVGLWFTLGSYEYRHGVHVMWLAGILVVASLSTLDEGVATASSGAVHGAGFRRCVGDAGTLRRAAVVACCVVLASAGALTWVAQRENRDISDGQRTGFAVQMAHPQAAKFHQHVVDTQSPVWVTTQYTWGFFYGRLPVGRPTINSLATRGGVRQELLALKAAYAISSGDYSYGEYSHLLVGLTERCPGAFSSEFTSRDGRYTVYRVDQSGLESCRPD